MPLAETQLISKNYTPVGDLITAAICMIMLALVSFSYVRKTPAFRIFLSIIPCLILASLLDVTANQLFLSMGAVPAVYVVRCLFHAILFFVFFLFTLYITEVTHMERSKTVITLTVAAAIVVTVVTADIVRSIQSHASANADSELSANGMIFALGHLAFVITIVILLLNVHHRLYKRVMWGFYSSVALSLLLLLMQGFMGGGSSFTVVTFLFPVIAMFYIMHSNPYDAEMGTIDDSALTDIIRECYDKKKSFLFLNLYLPLFSGEGQQIPDTIRSLVRKVSVDFFRGALLFQVGDGHLMMVFLKSRNPDYEHRIERILKAFKEYHRVYQYDYKIVIGESIDQISRKNEYISFVQSILRRMPANSIHRVSPEDVSSFDRSEYILQQLADINKQHDLDDKRVLVYCQPVLNVATGRYDTAEALMRLMLDGLGLVFPDQFIFLAEQHGYIHTLTEIILHKTCEEIRKLGKNGY